MQRGQVAVARAYTTASRQLDSKEAAHMPERLWPALTPGSSNSLPDDSNRYHQLRHSACSHRRPCNKTRKLKQPCNKFGSTYGCPFGDKCHYSHDLRALYPAYYDICNCDDPLVSDIYAMSRQTYQNYPQRPLLSLVDPPLISRSDPAHHSSSSYLPTRRERATLFANHWDSRSEDSRAFCNEKLFSKEAVVKVKQIDRTQNDESAALNVFEKNGCADENWYGNQDTIERKSKKANSKPRALQHQRPTRAFPRRCAARNGFLNSANGDPAKFYLYSNYVHSQVADQTFAACIQQQPRVREQHLYPRHLRLSAPEQVQPVGLSYTRYIPEKQLYSDISRQVETQVDSIDATLVSMEKYQHQATESLQKLVCTLWPDALIEIYGSSYTRLALPVSDIDCVLVARSLVDERPLVILEALMAEVEGQPWTKNVALLGSAKIPVLKITYSLDSTKQDVLLDLTCGHSVGHTGLGARDYINLMQLEMPALRPLVLILKAHLVAKQLNSAFTGGISSYVLVVLVIRFLQACGDTHMMSFTSDDGELRGANCRRSYLENAFVSKFPDIFDYVSSLSDSLPLNKPKTCYTFSRGGRVTWHTGIGNLLLLFLETYITFDYRRFGISIENKGHFFVLTPDKMVPMHCAVVIPYVADPIKPGRSICNCFRMHEVIQSWLALYQNLAAGVPIGPCIGDNATP